MTNDLLDVSRLEEGKMPIDRAEWDLTQMASEVRSALRNIDHERPIDIETAEARARDMRRCPCPPGAGEPRQQRHQAHVPPAAGFAYPIASA